MGGVPRILRDLFSGVDNHAFELGRALWALSILSILGYQGYALLLGQEFHPLEFGGGLATVLAAGGFGVAAKDKAKGEIDANCARAKESGQ